MRDQNSIYLFKYQSFIPVIRKNNNDKKRKKIEKKIRMGTLQF